MPPTRQLTVLRLFLASPSDLAAERDATKDVVDRLNSAIGKIGWAVELSRWEDRTPGYGRPQAQINKDVDACDLFLGILWRRWGSPSGSDFSSGFEEEFERAVSRRKQSESPEIWIYFKRVDDTSDPGDQLRQVLEFRKRIERQCELLFGKFSTLHEWERTCFGALLEYVLERASLEPSAEQQAARTRLQPLREDTVHAHPLNAEQQLPEQLRRVSVALRDAAKKPSSERFNAQLLDLEYPDLARLQLLGASLLYQTVSQDTLSNDAANLVYRCRDALGTLTWAESSFALLSMLREGNTYVPGWYWVKSLSEAVVARLLESIILSHSDEELKLSTLKLLVSRPNLQGMTRTNELVDAALSQSSDEMRTAGLNYAGRYGGSGMVEIIDNHISDMNEALKRTALAAIWRILRQHNPSQLLNRFLSELDLLRNGNIPFIGGISDELDNVTLRRLLEHSSADVRLIAAKTLTRKNLLTLPEAKALLDDSELRVRTIGIRRLIVFGEPLTAEYIRELLANDSKEKPQGLLALMHREQDVLDPDILVEELFSTLSYDQLSRLVDWSDLDGPIAYKVLGLKYFDRFEDRLRKDLTERFKTFCETNIQSQRTGVRSLLDKHRASHPQIIAGIEDGFEKQIARLVDLNDFITTRFVSAALTALAKNGSATDLATARELLDSRDPATIRAALDLISRFGDDSDVEGIIAVAEREYGDNAKKAAKYALDLSPDSWIRAKQYLERKTIPFLYAGIEVIATHTDFSGRWQELVPFLSAPNTVLRTEIARLFCKRFDHSDLAILMNQCLEDGEYYYDVITIFDRALYAPKVWRSI